MRVAYITLLLGRGEIKWLIISGHDRRRRAHAGVQIFKLHLIYHHECVQCHCAPELFDFQNTFLASALIPFLASASLIAGTHCINTSADDEARGTADRTN